MVAPAAMFPECGPTRIGHLHRPALADLHRSCKESLQFAVALCVVGSVECHQHVGIVGREQVDALIENGEVGEFHVGHASGGRGDRRIKYGRVAERGIECTGRVDRGHGSGRAAGKLRGDAAAGVHLGPGHVAVQVDATWHHDPATGIDPCEGLWIGGPGDDPAVLHPDVVHDAITPVQRVVDRAAGEDETV